MKKKSNMKSILFFLFCFVFFPVPTPFISVQVHVQNLIITPKGARGLDGVAVR